MQRKKSSSSKKNIPIAVEFTNKNLTSWGGISSLISHYLERLDFRSWSETNIPVDDTSNNSVSKYSKILSLFLTVLSGGRRFSHVGMWWHGESVFRESFSVDRFSKASSSSTRFWNKICNFGLSEMLLSNARNLALKIVHWDNVNSDDLRFDSSVVTRYGNQEGAVKGYNPKKRGRNSHNPIIAFLGSGYVINLWNRRGNASSGNGIIEFFKQTRSVLGNKFKVLRVACDSGYYLIDFIKYLEANSYTYIISAPMSQLLQKKILEQKEWTHVADGIEVTDFKFKHLDSKWDKERRYVAVRQMVAARPKATGKQMTLPLDIPETIDYRYSVMITNDQIASSKEVWNGYRPRANDENVIKELKDSYGFDSYNLKSFWATEAVMAMIALVLFNLVFFLKKHVINKNSKIKQKLSTIRMNHFIVPAALGSNGRKKILRLGVKDSKKQNFIINMLQLINKMNFTLNCDAIESG